MQYAALIPAGLIQPYLHALSPRLSLLLSLFEVCVSLAGVSILPAFYGSVNCVFMAFASLMFAIAVVLDGRYKARNTWSTHSIYASMGLKTDCKCGCQDSTRPYPHAACIQRGHGSFGMHLVDLDTGNASPVTHIVEGKERLDVHESGLQLVAYSSLIMWCGLVVLFGGYEDSAGYIEVLSLMFVAATTFVRVPVNLKTQCAYIRRSRTIVVHFLCLASCVMTITFASVVLATRLFANDGDIAAYVLLVNILPFFLARNSRVVKCDRVHAQTDRFVKLVQSCDLFLYSWWNYRVWTECAWWSWVNILAFANVHLTPAPPANSATPLQIVFSSIALAFALILTYDTVRFAWPLMRQTAGN